MEKIKLYNDLCSLQIEEEDSPAEGIVREERRGENSIAEIFSRSLIGEKKNNPAAGERAIGQLKRNI